MTKEEFKNWVFDLINDPKVDTISIINWKECGAHTGENPMPVFTLKKIEESNIIALPLMEPGKAELLIHDVKYTIIEDKDKGFMLVRNGVTTLTIKPLTNNSVKIE